jgi:hypothetical protein
VRAAAAADGRGCLVGGRLADSHLPDVGAGLQVIPGELAFRFGLELVEERLRIVVIDQQQASPADSASKLPKISGWRSRGTMLRTSTVVLKFCVLFMSCSWWMLRD